MEERKEYAAVDLFKMFCAILVMMIHTKPFENIFWLDAGIGIVTRFAVPFFFTVSGYFLFKRVDQNPGNRINTIGQYLFRLLRFYLIWFVIFRLVDIALGHSTNSWGYIIRQFFFPTDGSPLWFVNALLWAVIIVSIVSKWICRKVIFFIGTAFLLIGYSLSTLLGITADWGIVKAIQPIISFIGIQNGLFFAFPYVAMGAVLAEKELTAEYKKNTLLVALFFICLGAESLLAVLKLKAPLTFLWISALPMTWYVVKLMLTIDLEKRPQYYMVRKISTLFYVLHVIVFEIFQKWFGLMGIADQMNLLITLVTFIVTSGTAYALYRMSNKMPWLKYAM